MSLLGKNTNVYKTFASRDKVYIHMRNSSLFIVQYEPDYTPV